MLIVIKKLAIQPQKENIQVGQKKRSIAMKKIRKIEKIVNAQTLLVTVDISKFKHTGYFRCPDGTEVLPFEFTNNRIGFTIFSSMIERTKSEKRLNRVVIGFESTGPYAEPLTHYLRNKQVELVQVNPVHTKRIKEISDNSPGKTDKKDPKVIADLIELNRVLKVVVPVGISAELRRLTHARERYLKVKTLLVNQLYDLVFLIFPEFGQIIKDIQTKTAQYLLNHYLRPQQIIELGVDQLETILRKVSRGRFGREKAEQLFEAAEQSVGIREGQVSIFKEINNLLQGIAQQQVFISDCESDICRNLEQISWSRNLLSIKGIGNITVATIIGEVADFTHFKTSDEVEKFAGLNLFEISSGKHKGQKRISKRGRWLLRKCLYFASLNVVRKDGIFHDQYQSYLHRGMLKQKALIAIARKLLRVIFAIVRDHKEFDCSYYRPNQLKEAA